MAAGHSGAYAKENNVTEDSDGFSMEKLCVAYTTDLESFAETRSAIVCIKRAKERQTLEEMAIIKAQQNRAYKFAGKLMLNSLNKQHEQLDDLEETNEELV